MTTRVFDQVVACLAEVFANKGLSMPTVTVDTALDATLGLESLDYAELVVRLEDAFDLDPFDVASPPQVRKLGDLVALYEAA